MDGPVDFIDAEQILSKLEALDKRLQLIEGILEAICAELGIEMPARENKE